MKWEKRQFVARAVASAVLVLWRGVPARGNDTGSFQPVGSLTQARFEAEATLLSDGTVLVTGGEDITSDVGAWVGTAQLFDPKTNQFTAAIPMLQSHPDQRAVRLRDGRVLVVQGGSPIGGEIYDPKTRSFTSAGSMGPARVQHTATLLLDGRVLVTGGSVGLDNRPVETSELFDPTTNSFVSTGSMTTPRSSHAAVALPDGRVVVLGGIGRASVSLASVEIYDPQSGSFSPRGSLVEAREGMGAALLSDGRVMVVGGTYYDPPTYGGARGSIEIYDPASGRSAIVGSLGQPRSLFGMAPLPGGRFLVAGGNAGDPTFTVLGSAEIIDPNTGKVTSAAAMTTARSGPAVAALADGRVLIAGGLAGSPPFSLYALRSAEVYSPGSANGQQAP